ncbi:variable large family protein [Borreliella garinii]|uniref:Variable large protein n=6 Tax=Borreliella garinii TaxID=29519 RepID=B8F0S7_BORGR|nr:variable large family protein [Borreliella garinii]ACL34505.1 outer surface protein VlsE [Borreliella garinii PBr]
MKKISSAIFTIVFLVFINCKSDARKAINSIQTQKFTSFDGLLIDGFLSLKPNPKKSEVKDYFNSMAKTLNKTKDKLAKLISEKGGKTTEENNTDTAKEDNSTVNPVDNEINKIKDMIDKMIDAANTIVETVAETATETMGEVVEVKSSGNVATKADVKSVVEIAKGIKKIVGAAGIADKLKAEADKTTKPISEESNNKEAGKMFSGKQGDQGGKVIDSDVISPEIGGGANPMDINKAAEAVKNVSGEQILGAIIAAAKAIESGGKATTEGKNADEAKNPIEAAIGGNDDSNATAFTGNMEKDTQIAAAIVLRGMAKNGKFAVKMGRGPSADGNTIRALVKNAANKTVDALSQLVLKAINESLTKIAKTIKAGGEAANEAVNSNFPSVKFAEKHLEDK